VAGHAVFRKGCTTPDLAALDSSRMGGYPGEGPFYIEHVRAGVLRAAHDLAAILMFSGGMTQAVVGLRSEAESYREVARDHDWWGHREVAGRTLTEDCSRDSFENLWCSIALYRQHTGALPDSITAIGWRFKAERFQLHREALGWPADRFEYLGVNDPEGAALEAALAKEEALREAVKEDPFLRGPAFEAKREQRNPFRREHGYTDIETVCTWIRMQ
jgi:hypothetical protein